MILVDVNILINAVNGDSPHHSEIRNWLQARLSSGDSIGIPWVVINGFVRITTLAKVLSNPLTLDEALQTVSGWLALPNVRIVHPADTHLQIFSSMCRAANASGNLITDAHLAALAVEHGLRLASIDTDFAKFPGLQWVNPLIP